MKVSTQVQALIEDPAKEGDFLAATSSNAIVLLQQGELKASVLLGDPTEKHV